MLILGSIKTCYNIEISTNLTLITVTIVTLRRVELGRAALGSH